MRRHLLRFGGNCGRRSFANDLEYGVPILGAVIVDLLGKMGDEAAGRQWDRAVWIEFGARAYPPSSGNDRDKPVVRMIVGMAHVMRGPLVQEDVRTWFRRVPAQNRHGATARVINPGDIFGKLNGDCGWVEIGGLHRSNRHNSHYR